MADISPICNEPISGREHDRSALANLPLYISSEDDAELPSLESREEIALGDAYREPAFTLDGSIDELARPPPTHPSGVVYPAIPGYIPYDEAPAPGPVKIANPNPIGLLGFGMTTVLMSLHDTGHYKLSSSMPAMAVCFGGGAQFIAGLLEYHKGNTFACVYFTSFGSFWFSLTCIWMLPNNSYEFGPPAVYPVEQYSFGVYLLIWGIFALVMALSALRTNFALFFTFFTVTLSFFLLAFGNMCNNETVLKVAGYEGVVCGASALYLAFAEVVNEVYDRMVLPIGSFIGFPPDSWRWSHLKRYLCGSPEPAVAQNA